MALDFHPKFVMFTRILGPLFGNTMISPETILIGVVDRLWQIATEVNRCGDLGDIHPEILADNCGWKGDPHVLIDALKRSRMIKDCGNNRFTLLDWREDDRSCMRAITRSPEGDIFEEFIDCPPVSIRDLGMEYYR